MSEEKKEIALRPVEELPIPINEVDQGDGLRLFKCPQCGHVHFRHAGYIEVPTPFVEPDKKEIKAVLSSQPVKLCINCKASYITYNSKVYDVTKLIDLNAWEKTEKEAHKATGPGGQC